MFQDDLDRLRLLEPNHPLLAFFETSGDTYYSRRRLERELESLEVSSPEPAPVATTKQRPAKELIPEALWPAHDRQTELYKVVNHHHPQLELLYLHDVGRCFQAAKTLLQAWKEIDSIYRIIDYWNQNNVVLPNKYSPVPSGVPEPTDLRELMRRQEACKRFISRNKDNEDKAEEVKQRRAELVTIRGMIHAH